MAVQTKHKTYEWQKWQLASAYLTYKHGIKVSAEILNCYKKLAANFQPETESDDNELDKTSKQSPFKHPFLLSVPSDASESLII